MDFNTLTWPLVQPEYTTGNRFKRVWPGVLPMTASPAESAERNDPSYNYGRFEFEAHGVPDDRVEAGDHAPDGTVYELDGTARRLEELYTDRPLVLEFGSATCPIFTRKCNRMDALATRCDDVRFAVVYAREAHPGSNVDAHETFADKLERASST